MNKLPKPFFILAPMDDVTDTVFRQIIATLPYPSHLSGVQGAGEQRTEDVHSGTSKEQPQPATQQSAKSTNGAAGSASRQGGAVRRYGPDLFFTEFVNVDGLQSPGRPKLIHKLLLNEKEKPVIAQLWGLKPENFYKTTLELKKMGFAGVDINMGCPVRTVIKNGACAALINNRELAGEIIDAVQDAAGDFPVNVKTRVGFTTVDYSWIEFLLSKKLNMLSIHARTAHEMSKVPADWSRIGKVREIRDELCPSTLIVGNGDVADRAQGLSLAKTHKLDGIMIGRGIFDDPFAFSADSPWEGWAPEQKLDLFKKHIELHIQTYRNGERRFETLRKFCKVYINGFEGASELRAEFMEARTPEQALELLAAVKV
ncbi:MAG: tRNA-dihydrouridine synthase [Candidatus Saccharibacteria bacterium]|nr:tRNA-dihydrouridine synthase [Candidatus Saccharibacteria bacterium]